MKAAAGRRFVRQLFFGCSALCFGSVAHALPPISDCTPEALDLAAVPPEKFATSPGGVDMRTGDLTYSHVDLEIGGANGLKLERTLVPITQRLRDDRFGKTFGDNWNLAFEERRVAVCEANAPDEYDYVVTVRAGQLGAAFRSPYSPIPDPNFDDSGTFVHLSPTSGALLSFDYSTASGANRPTRYYMMATDGTRVDSRQLPTGITRPGAWVQDIRKPDGTFIHLDYDVVSPASSVTALRGVSSNHGYAILYEYAQYGTAANWRVAKACAINTAVTAMPALNAQTVCPAGVPTATYAYDSNGELISFTDQSGVPTKVGAGATALYSAGANTPYVTNTISVGKNRQVNSQSFATDAPITYSWVAAQGGDNMGGSFTRSGSTVTVTYSQARRTDTSGDPTWYVSPGPVAISDELARTSQYSFCRSGTSGSTCDYGPLQAATDPKGIRREFTYDTLQRLTRLRTLPADGSAPVEETWSFGCTVPSCRFKPTSTTDARANTTTMVYDPAHGALLKKTSPADANGIRPEVRYSYAQRYTWLKSGGGFAQSSSPIWVLASEEYCKSSAADANGSCAAGSGDKVSTSYQYQAGNSSSGSNLLLLGIAVTSGGQTRRTCFTYDGLGRKVSETQPMGTGSSCP